MFDFWRYMGRVSTVILTVCGILFLPSQVYEFTQSWPMTIAVTALALITLGISACVFLFPGLINRRFGVARYRARAIVPRRQELVEINDKFQATVTRRNEIIFLDTPSAEDRLDLIDLLPGEEMHERSYRSSDSTVGDTRRKGLNTLAIYWLPKKPITPYVPYEHEMSYVSPSLYGDDAFYNSLLVDREIGITDIEVRSERKIEEVVGFVMPVWAAAVTIKRLYNYGLSGRRRGCEQPVLLGGGHKVVWSLSRPKRGRVYVMLGIYAGQKDRYVRESRELFALIRFGDFLRSRGILPQLTRRDREHRPH